MSRFDVVIVGQGLAGTVLAWHLRGRRVLVIDREEAVTSSKVAAGLMTPVTGKRLAASWRWDEAWPAAAAFYRRVEDETGRRFLHVGPAVRIFADAGERDVFERRSLSGLCEVNPAWFAAQFGAFEMAAGRLDVPLFLAASRDHFRRADQYLAADIDPVHDVEVLPDRVRLPRLGVEAERLVFCQGFASNPHFADITFNPVKGEVLTLHVPGLDETRVIHRGVWLAPLGGERLLAGSTYDRTQLDCVPTPAGRDEICERLRQFLRMPFEVVSHAAAVRPVIDAGRVAAEVRGRLAFFNGLGSKGSVLAPLFAAELAAKLA